ncbi:hypothetical protein [Cellulomonas fimi]|uniref:MinD-like ATPase involved in chromosome partitioning or flagellar assembly n=1 Tax=Cellulomonas fimi TaxID=1708 RepID=A0A7Y0LVY5_CELFI|nr:hypothetical protein [Cellulomonas fimi]NMR19227.1 hypothetical protein [Cellulomonas fimi]
MSVLVFCSATGAPGVTATALVVAWALPLAHPGRRSLVVDADVAGSGILPGFLRAGVGADGGILALASDRTAVSGETLLEHAVALDEAGARWVLTGITDPAQGRTVRDLATSLAEGARALHEAGVDVVVDVGRLGHRYEPTALLERADVVAVVFRSTLPSITGARAALGSLHTLRGPAAATLGVVVGAARPYGAGEIARELHLPGVLTLPEDPWAAGILTAGGGTGRRFENSALVRGARALATELTAAGQGLRPVREVRS